MFKQERLPFVDKCLIDYLKETYSTQNLISLTKKNTNAENALGFMSGVYEVIERLEALSKREDD